jgi:hypothetical protein
VRNLWSVPLSKHTDKSQFTIFSQQKPHAAVYQFSKFNNVGKNHGKKRKKNRFPQTIRLVERNFYRWLYEIVLKQLLVCCVFLKKWYNVDVNSAKGASIWKRH